MNRALTFLLFSSVAASAQQYVISTFAGGVPPVTPAAAAGVSIGDPPRVAVDPAGNTYFAGLHAIFKVDRSGSMVRIAGTGRAGLTGDGGPATAAQLDDPVGLAVDAAGNVYYSERTAGLIRKISSSGIISRLLVPGLNGPMGLTLDAAGNLYVADTGNNVVRKFNPSGLDGVVSVLGAPPPVAGNGSSGFSGDGGPALSASFNGPEGIAVDAAGNLYIADTFNNRVRRVAPDGTISTFAGTGFPGFSGDDGAPASARMILPTDVALDSSGAVYIADLGNSRIRKVANGVISTVAGNSDGVSPVGGLKATAVRLSGPTGVAVDASGAIYIAEGSIGSGSGLDGGVFDVWKVTTDGKLTTLAGTGLRSFSGDGGPAVLAQFNNPAGLALDGRGNLYIADSGNHRVRKIAADGTVTTVAGNALAGFSGDGGPATSAQLRRPTGVAVDASGNLFIADSGNNRIRMVFPNGVIGTLAGNGNAALFGDGGNSIAAALNHPEGVAVDADGAVYVADTGNHVIRRVVNAVIDTVRTGFSAPTSLALGQDGLIVVADAGTNAIFRTLVGASAATPLIGAHGVAIDAAGNIYATGEDRVVKLQADGSALTIAGTGQCCYAGDGGPAGAALLSAPWGLVADPSGNLYIADSGNDAIRLAAASASTFFIRSITNAASNQVGPLAPGEIVTIYGVGLGPSTLVATDPSGSLPTDLAGTSVTFNGISAPLFYVSAGQIAAQVPYAVVQPSPRLVDVVVKAGNVSTQPFSLPIGSAPGIFTTDSTGSGQARAINADGTANSPARPAVAGTPLTLYATGEGLAGAPVSVTIGGKSAIVQNTSGGPGATPAGLLRVTVVVPTGVSGQLPVVLTVLNSSSQGDVTVAIE